MEPGTSGQFVILATQDWEKVVAEISELKNMVAEFLSKNDQQPIWLDTAEAMEFLKISRRCLQRYRDEGVIGFSQVGSKIYFRQSDLEKHLQTHYHQAFRNNPFPKR